MNWWLIPVIVFDAAWLGFCFVMIASTRARIGFASWVTNQQEKTS